MKKLLFVFAFIGMITMSGCNSNDTSSNDGEADLSLGVNTTTETAQ